MADNGRAERPLYLMAKPPAGVRDRIWALGRTDRRRPAELLHMTLLGFVDLATAPAAFVPALVVLLDAFRAEAFMARFDVVSEWDAVALRASGAMPGVAAFRAALVAHLGAHGFRFFGDRTREPHVTINYRRDGVGREPITPIAWEVSEFLLIESLVGERRHVEHGRWQLDRSQRDLFAAA